MSWFGDNWDFERNNLKHMWGKAKDDPWRLLVGSFDSVNTPLWNKILGRDDKPFVDLWGAPAKDSFQDARDKGINTDPAEDTHRVARGIASIMALMYGAGAAAPYLSGGGGVAPVEGMGMGAAPGEAAGSFTGSAVPSGGGASWTQYIPKQMPGQGQSTGNKALDWQKEQEARLREEEYRRKLAEAIVQAQGKTNWSGWNYG